MTKLDFFTTREIPTSGHIMTIRDKRMHFLNRDNGIFSCPWGKSAYKTVSDTDLLYCFPTMETPYEYISNGKCIDSFQVKFKGISRDNIRAKIIELLKGGAYIARLETDPKYKQLLKLDNGTIRGYDKDGQMANYIITNFTQDVEFYKFENEFQAFKYLYT